MKCPVSLAPISLLLKKLSIVICWGVSFLPLCPNLSAQNKSVSKQQQIWLQYYGKGRINSKWSIALDAGYRWNNFLERRSQHLIRPAIFYQFNPNIRLATGIARLGFFTDGELTRVEWRPHQELNIRHPFAHITFKQRYRLEQRLLNPLENGKESDFHFRIRYALAVSIPLLALSKTHLDRRLSLGLGNELFMNAGPSITHDFFDQNRMLVSPALHWNKNLILALVWNQQFGTTSIFHTYKSTRVIWLQLRHKLDLRKDK